MCKSSGCRSCSLYKQASHCWLPLFPKVDKLLLQAISLDFLGVPGSEVASKTADLIEKHGFPQDKRLGAGVVDGRSVWADGETPSALVAALQAKVSSILSSISTLRFSQKKLFCLLVYCDAIAFSTRLQRRSRLLVCWPV